MNLVILHKRFRKHTRKSNFYHNVNYNIYLLIKINESSFTLSTSLFYRNFVDFFKLISHSFFFCFFYFNFFFSLKICWYIHRYRNVFKKISSSNFQLNYILQGIDVYDKNFYKIIGVFIVNYVDECFFFFFIIY